MIRSATETLPTYNPLRIVDIVNAILTRVDSTMGKISAAQKAANIAYTRESISLQELEHIGLIDHFDPDR